MCEALNGLFVDELRESGKQEKIREYSLQKEFVNYRKKVFP